MKAHFDYFAKLAATAALLLTPVLGQAQAVQTECEGVTLRQKAVSMPAPRLATVDFSGSGGHLDPTPILETQIQLLARTCVVVTFSAQADPQDNHIIFQASADNVPMSGHAIFPYLTPAPQTLVVWDPEETNLNVSRMLSYTFFATLGAGTHTLRIRFAGCCSPVGNSAIVRNAVLSVHF